MAWLEKFVAESNKIEGITRAPLEREIEAHRTVLALTEIGIPDLQEFVRAVAPRHLLRNQVGLDVYVGNHIPPAGGPDVIVSLTDILEEVNDFEPLSPYQTHIMYETLHPFTDGNGRSGRVLWLWSMQKANRLHQVMQLGFLHTWYYQTLEANQ